MPLIWDNMSEHFINLQQADETTDLQSWKVRYKKAFHSFSALLREFLTPTAPKYLRN